MHVSPAAPVGRTELMRRLLHDGIPTRRGVMAIHTEPAYAGADLDPAEHRDDHARDDDAAALPGHDGRAAGPRHRPPRVARDRSGGVSPKPLLIVGGGGFARETLELVRAVNGGPAWHVAGILDDDPRDARGAPSGASR